MADSCELPGRDSDSEPRISIVLPVWNAETTLQAAIASIQAQDFPDWELIVVDDGSTDTSRAIAEFAARSDPRIIVMACEHRGLVPALREGCALARGAYLARMDADDLSRPARFSRQLAWFASHPQGGLCGTQVRMTGGPIRAGRRRYETWLNSHSDHAALDQALFVECPLAHPAFMLPRAVYEAVGGYRDFDGPEDYDLALRIWHAGYELGNIPEVLLEWREAPRRLSMISPRYTEAAFRQLKREWLQRANVGGGRPWYQWGAGEVGKRWLREWPPGVIEAVADIRPSKIGQNIHGYPVIRPEDLPPPGQCFIVVAVGTPGARDIIRARCFARGYTECTDYRFIA
jgi:glycosyltransferase involved in cell wall biosynthesis